MSRSAAGGPLGAALEAAAAGLDPVERHLSSQGAVEYLRGGRAFAVIEPNGVACFRLGPAVGAAALRTPDTRPSPRGAGWIALSPVVVDGHALDRAAAWLASAWRHAVE